MAFTVFFCIGRCFNGLKHLICKGDEPSISRVEGQKNAPRDSAPNSIEDKIQANVRRTLTGRKAEEARSRGNGTIASTQDVEKHESMAPEFQSKRPLTGVSSAADQIELSSSEEVKANENQTNTSEVLIATTQGVFNSLGDFTSLGVEKHESMALEFQSTRPSKSLSSDSAVEQIEHGRSEAGTRPSRLLRSEVEIFVRRPSKDEHDRSEEGKANENHRITSEIEALQKEVQQLQALNEELFSKMNDAQAQVEAQAQGLNSPVRLKDLREKDAELLELRRELVEAKTLADRVNGERLVRKKLQQR